MTQNFFGTLTSPSLPLLDANFTELYAGVTVPDAQPAQVFKSPTAYLRLWPYYTPDAAAMIDVVNTAASAFKDLVIYSSSFKFGGGPFLPVSDNALNIGSASKRPAQYYGASGTINTSDAREKTPVSAFGDAEMRASIALSKEIGTYQWLAAVQEKGSAARMHIGLTVQRAIEIMTEHGLNPMRYAFICYDAWPAETVPARTAQRPTGQLDATGKPIAETVVIEPEKQIPAGDRYSFRHEELLLFLARGLEARLTALEAAA